MHIKPYHIRASINAYITISHRRRGLNAFGVGSEQKYSQCARQSEQHSMQCPVVAESTMSPNPVQMVYTWVRIIYDIKHYSTTSSLGYSLPSRVVHSLTNPFVNFVH